MKGFSPASGTGYLVCPVCEAAELHHIGGEYARCRGCGYAPDPAMLLTLEQIVALPGALGKHACECGHPEMRHLPDGVFHCPACGTEVLTVETTSDPGERASDRLERGAK